MKETKTPRERRHQRTREAILTAARQLIAERGADNLSLRAVARRIDYSPAGLYEYFDSKDDIVDTLCQRGNAQLGRFLRRVPAGLPLEEYMVQLLGAYIDFARQNPELYSLMYTQLTVGISEVPAEFNPEDSFTILIRAVERGKDEGAFQVSDDYGVFEIAYSLWAMAHGMAMLQLNYMRGFNFDFERVDRKTVQVFLQGLIQRGK